MALAGCSPSDSDAKYLDMKDQMSWLKSVCQDDTNLIIVRKGPGSSIKFECSANDKNRLLNIDSNLTERGFVLVNEEQQTKTWCKDGISLHITQQQKFSASTYYPGSACRLRGLEKPRKDLSK